MAQLARNYIHDAALLSRPSIEIQDDIGRELDAARARGYFQIDPPNWVPVARMARPSDTRTAPLVPVFAFLFDEFTVMFHQLNNVTARLLGAGFSSCPISGRGIDPPRGRRVGAHRDDTKTGLLPDGRPKCLTVRVADGRHAAQQVHLRGAPSAIHTIRRSALAVQSDMQGAGVGGSVLCWNSGVLHWGPQLAARPSQPQVSVAYSST